MKDRNQQLIELYQTCDYSLQELSKQFNISRERARQICSRYILRSDIEKIKEKRSLDKLAKRFGSLEKYAEFKEKRNLRKLRKVEGAWHWQYDACIDCGTTEKPFKARGRCDRCDAKYIYHNRPGRKESCSKSAKEYRLKNLDKIKAHQKEYFKTYYANPKNRERIRLSKREYYNTPEGHTKIRNYQREYYKK